MNTVTAIRNQDRYLKCRSCRATAAYIFSAQGVTVTTIYAPGHGETTVRPWRLGSCARHAKLNRKRTQEATSKVVDKSVCTNPRCVCRERLGAPECPICHGTGTDPETGEQCECVGEAES